MTGNIDNSLRTGNQKSNARSMMATSHVGFVYEQDAPAISVSLSSSHPSLEALADRSSELMRTARVPAPPITVLLRLRKQAILNGEAIPPIHTKTNHYFVMLLTI